jgi:hypothetical protein
MSDAVEGQPNVLEDAQALQEKMFSAVRFRQRHPAGTDLTRQHSLQLVLHVGVRAVRCRSPFRP